MPDKKKLSNIINPSKKQQEFLDTVKENKYTLYGGAKGGGKSYILRWGLVKLLIQWAKEGHEGVRAGLFCEDYPSLKDRQITKINKEFPSWLGTLSDSQTEGMSFKLNERYGGGVIMLRNLDDPSKYASSEFAAAAVDELTKNKRKVFDTLRGIIRWPGIDHTKFMAGTNPGDIGHHWVKKLWVDRDFSDDEVEPEEFAYVHANARDNPHLSEQYVKTLEALPEEKRKAYLEGSWDMFKGQFFSEFRQSIHMVDPFPIPDDWPKYRAIDFGRTAPFVCLWFAVKPGQDKPRVFCYREYKQENTDADINFERVVELSGDEVYEWTVLDSACFAAHKNARFNRGQGDTIADEAWRKGINAQPSPKDRKAGWNLMHQHLRWNEFDEETGNFEKVEPKMVYFKRRTPYIEKTLPSLVHDENDPDDLDTDGPDHAVDANSYFLQAFHTGFNNTVEPRDIKPDSRQKDREKKQGSVANQIAAITEGSENKKQGSFFSNTFLNK